MRSPTQADYESLIARILNIEDFYLMRLHDGQLPRRRHGVYVHNVEFLSFMVIAMVVHLADSFENHAQNALNRPAV